MDTITFRYLISFAVHEKLHMQLMNVVTAYLYGQLDNNIYIYIYMKVLGLNMPETYNLNSQDMYSIKLQRSLYGLKQSGCMWYHRLSEYLLKEGYKKDPICPCVFIKKSEKDM